MATYPACFPLPQEEHACSYEAQSTESRKESLQAPLLWVRAWFLTFSLHPSHGLVPQCPHLGVTCICAVNTHLVPPF